MYHPDGSDGGFIQVPFSRPLAYSGSLSPSNVSVPAFVPFIGPFLMQVRYGPSSAMRGYKDSFSGLTTWKISSIA